MNQPYNAGNTSGGTNQQTPADSGAGAMMFIMLMTMVILFDKNMRRGLGIVTGSFLEPLAGFDYSYPIFTILVASSIMIFFNTAIRHKYTNWVEMAENQKFMSAFQKEFREARLSNNVPKINKLTEMQPEMLMRQQKMSSTQMKPMAFTMLIAISIFTWLGVFVESLDYAFFSNPWNPYINFRGSTVLPHWVLMYSLFSIPIGQALQKVLKYFDLKKELDKPIEQKVYSNLRPQRDTKNIISSENYKTQEPSKVSENKYDNIEIIEEKNITIVDYNESHEIESQERDNI